MKYGFLGCGNMGGAIARAMSSVTKDIIVCDRSGKAKSLAQSQGIAYGTAEQAAACERIFLAVKPNMLEAALSPLKETLAKTRPVLISMAAGVEIRRIEEMLGFPLPVIRIMPNTPVCVGKGLITFCHNDLVTRETLDDWLKDMAPCGIVDPVPEKLIDAASAVAGCGPAYMYIFAEALADAGVSLGLSRKAALEYAAMTMLGSAQMVLESGKHPGQLKDEVCSPGGSTIAGVQVLEEQGFRGTVMDCVSAAYNRTKALGK